MSQDIIKIDGGLMEGGGQILRMAVAFSALLKKPINVYNIRAGRSTLGLRPQHLAGLNLVRDLCNGNLIGAEVGSTEITFHPGAIVAGKYSADPGTAGSVMLLFQVSFPCLLFANGPSELHFRGGTNADMAPQIDHTIMVFKPLVEKLGAKFNCNIVKRGYYPKGGGEVVISVTPVSKHLNPIELLKPAEVVDIKGRSFVAGVLPVKVAHGMADAASRCLRAAFPGIPMKIDRVKESPQEAEGNGSGIVLVAKTASGCLIGGSALGKRGVQADAVGETAAKEILEDVQNQACVDRHVQDQLVIFMALAKGQSKVVIGKPTLHTETAIYIAELMTEAKYNIHQNETEEYSIMECTGIGLER